MSVLGLLFGALLGVTGRVFKVPVNEKAEALRGEYAVTVLAAAKKVGKQLDRLQQSGCAAACFYEKYPEIKPLGENA